MDLYEQLRREAAAKRDQAVQAARSEYKLAVRRINALRKQVAGSAPATLKKTADERPMAEKVKAILPRNREFTIPEVIDLMHADKSGARYKDLSIRSQFPALLAMGAIHRVGRRNGQVLWARPDAKVEVCPFGGATVPDIAEKLLRELGPMRVTEIVVEMRGRGYKPAQNEKHTAAIVLRAMTRFSGRFLRGNDGRWGVSAKS